MNIPEHNNLNSSNINFSKRIQPKPTFLDLLELATQVRKETKEFKEIGKQFCNFIKSK